MHITLDARLNIISVEPEYRFYTKAATDGFYVGGAATLLLLKYELSGSDSDTQFGLGAITGYQFALSPALQIGGGIGVILPNDNIDPTLKYNLNLRLGYAF